MHAMHIRMHATHIREYTTEIQRDSLSDNPYRFGEMSCSPGRAWKLGLVGNARFSLGLVSNETGMQRALVA